ncbi:RHS repeat domain-containing protein [Pseudomonas sp. ANT_H12B]|uniref:RHS repeat domain-containing protein n=1 Tax=Pseudomonas sp. ANT_H12B TaxID=2597348 RepID=UPI0011EC641F|nr:RHS repeat-associated core domain-containing protein [Pseudomonas sp. ANT_H12B]KAA0975079.1 RHS repeat-associated core domain-containing protein [Pseudomonas sp. ANT_H12B]
MHAQTPTVTVKDPRGLNVANVSYCRDAPGKTPEPRVNRQLYNAVGHPTVSWDPRLFKLLETEPDARPNLKTVFSLTGNPLSSDSVDAGIRLVLFGVAGQKLVSWDSLFTQVQTHYDLLLRPVKTVERASGKLARTSACYAYGVASRAFALRNQCGRLIRHDDSAGTVHFSVFALIGGVIEQTRHFLEELDEPDWPADEAARDLLHEAGTGATTRNKYNAMAFAISQEDAQGNVRFSRLNVAGQLSETSLQLAAQTQETPLLSAIHYNAFGNIERQTAGNGVISEAHYCPRDGRLLELKACLPDKPLLQHLSYRYDRVGNILSISDATLRTRFFRNQKVEPTNTFTYNTLYQLIEANGWQRIRSQLGPQQPVFESPPDPGQLENYRQTYSYDCAGNLTELIHSAASHSQTQRMCISKYSNRGLVQKADGELPTESEIAAGFDANGNKKLLLPGQDLIWSLNNRLQQVDQVVREDAPNDSEIYIYDEAGLRQRKIRIASTGTLTRTHEVRYLPGLEIRKSPDEILHVISVPAGHCTVQIFHWEKGGPSAVATNQLRYSLNDHLGSSTLVLNDQAKLISLERYYPYGGTAWWAGSDRIEAGYSTLRYCGKERDATGLYYYGARYYSPWWQRWLNPDPAGTVDGLNLYQFVRSNPVTLFDPDGRNPQQAIEAFNHMLSQGSAWRQLDTGDDGLTTFQQQSGKNIRQLEDRLSESIELESAEALFLDEFSKSPFHLVHFSDKDLRKNDVVELYSRKQLVERQLIFNENNTAEGDLTSLGTDDFVFFSLEAQREPAKPSSRFGDKRYRTPFSTLQDSGQAQYSLLQSLDIILPASRPKGAPAWVKDARAYGRDFALRDNEDEDTQRHGAMFVGEDMIRGMGLNVMIDVLNYAEDAGDTLYDVPADRLMNDLYRPQVLVPHSVRLKPQKYSYQQTRPKG